MRNKHSSKDDLPESEIRKRPVNTSKEAALKVGK